MERWTARATPRATRPAPRTPHVNSRAHTANHTPRVTEPLNATIGTGSASPGSVTFSTSGAEDGTTPATGFNMLLEGASYVSNGGTIIISGGSSSETIFIPAAMTLQSGGGTVTIGSP